MSRFIDTVIATATRSPRGMVTGEPGTPVRRSWRELHHSARRAAAALVDGGLHAGQTVAVLSGDPAEVARVAQGIWLAGGSLTMLHQPTPRTDLTVWRDDTLRVMRMIDAHFVLVGSPFEPMAGLLQEQGIRHRMIGDLDSGRTITVVESSEESTALLQLTSGSTAEPKAVQITHRNLYTNLLDSTAHLECDENHDVMVSWLPLFHDMGMVGCLLIPMFSGIDLVSVTPMDFLNRPMLWAELMSRYGGTITAAPNFAYAILARQLARAAAGSLDLSRLRVACNGAEPIDPSTMEQFVAAGVRFGLRSQAVNCCYGAAESALVISLSRLSDPMIIDTVDALELEKNRRAVPAAANGRAAGDDAAGNGAAGDDAADDAGSGVRRLPMLGTAFPGVEVRVVDDSGVQLGDREIGRLQLRGDSVTAGYLTEQGPVAALDADGWLDIGDEGYLVDGQIVVCGRRKDVIIMAGRNIYPTDIERAAAAVDGIREGNVAAVRLMSGDGVARESFAVLVESRLAGDEAAEDALRKAVTTRVVSEVDARPALVTILPPGSLPKTPSGKLRRSAARALVHR